LKIEHIVVVYIKIGLPAEAVSERCYSVVNDLSVWSVNIRRFEGSIGINDYNSAIFECIQRAGIRAVGNL